MFIQRKILESIKKWLKSDKILILNGARQVGKTTILKRIKKELEKQEKNCIYLNLESFQIATQLDENPDNLFHFVDNDSDFYYFFIDEIQILENPSHFLKYIYDFYREKVKLIVTGSANLEIKAKIQDSLVGRKMDFFIQPLLISEILNFKKLNPKSKNPLERQKIEEEFQNYLLFGGLPDIFLEKNLEHKKELLKEYIGAYVNKDIRGLIRNININKFNKLNIYLAHSIGNLLNKSKLTNEVNLDSRTLDHYLDLLEFSFIFKFVSPYFSNPITQIKRMSKVFCFDLGVRNAILNNFIKPDLRDDNGRLFENFIYLILRAQKQEIFFWRTNRGDEVDFLYQENGIHLLEVKYKQFKETKIENSFKKAIKEFKPTTANILNLNLNKSFKYEDQLIKFVSWDYLLV